MTHEEALFYAVRFFKDCGTIFRCQNKCHRKVISTLESSGYTTSDGKDAAMVRVECRHVGQSKTSQAYRYYNVIEEDEKEERYQVIPNEAMRLNCIDDEDCIESIPGGDLDRVQAIIEDLMDDGFDGNDLDYLQIHFKRPQIKVSISKGQQKFWFTYLPCPQGGVQRSHSRTGSG